MKKSVSDPPPDSPVIRFGAFELDRRTGELRKNGLKVKLQEQPFQVLTELLTQPGEVVTREELREKLWLADTFVDFDHSLGTAIKKIRQALGDAATNPRFVETLPKRGYRFIAPVETGETGEAEPVRAQPAGARNTRGLVYIGAAACAVALVVFALLSRSASSVAPGSSEDWKVVPFTSYTGSEISPSFSPDGDHIAFAWNGENRSNYDIYIKKLGSQKSVRLTSTSLDELAPAWSPDGRHIAFVRYDAEGKGSLNVMPSTGGSGSEQTLGEVLTQQFRFGGFAPMSHLAWTPDSKRLILSDKTEAPGPAQLFRVSLETGERRQLTMGPGVGADGDFHPAVSPDGKTLAFVRDLGGFLSHIYTSSLSDNFEPVGRPRLLGRSGQYVYQPSWTPDGNSILYGVFKLTSVGATPWQIWSMSAFGNDRWAHLALPGHYPSRPIVASHGNRLAYVRTRQNHNIWRLDLQAFGKDPRAPLPVLSSTQADWDPRYSPDGRWIAFKSDRSSPPGIWIAGVDGSNPRLLYAKEGERPGSPRWSPDSERIVLDSRQGAEQNQPQLFVVNVNDGRALRLTNSQSSDVVASWSRDGRWIYFSSNRTGRSETWKVSAGGGEPVRITVNGGGSATESPDGATLYFVKSMELRTSLWKVPVTGGVEELVLEPVYWWNFEPTAGGIYYIEPPGRGYSIRYFNLKTGKAKTLWQLPPDSTASFGLSVAPSETKLLFALRDQESDIWLVENFQ